MNLQTRINLLAALGDYIMANDKEWQEVKHRASEKNGWFTLNFIDIACENIASQFLKKDKLEQWTSHYHVDDNIDPKTVGIVMAGNIPLVGFHDFLCVFICGHRQKIKFSSKDDVLLPFLIRKLNEQNELVREFIETADMLKGCDAYIATGSNNTARYFEQYFAKYPHIIRKNRTSVAVLKGDETESELQKLSDDIHLYFGLGCRNVNKIYVPEAYDFVPLLKAFNKFIWIADHHKYKNNYDYQLSILLLNNIYYMTNGCTLITQNKNLFSPISQVFYEEYNTESNISYVLEQNSDIQCIIGKDFLYFGKGQNPDLFSYADGVDTLQFLLAL